MDVLQDILNDRSHGLYTLLSILLVIGIFIWWRIDRKKRAQWHESRKDRMQRLKEEAMEKLQAEIDNAKK